MNSKHLLFGLLLFSVIGWGQINFEVFVSKKQLGLNERLRVDFKIDKPGDNFRPPKFSSFRVISGPMPAGSPGVIMIGVMAKWFCTCVLLFYAIVNGCRTAET